MANVKVLIVCTSHDKLGNTNEKTGCWLEEFAAPYYILTAAGFDVTLASIKGGRIPLDESSKQESNLTDHSRKFLSDAEAMRLLDSSPSIADISNLDQYSAVFVPGGHGIVFDGPTSDKLRAVLEAAFAQGRVVASVCHGPAAFIGAKGPDGKPLVNGRKVAGFSNSEEQAVGKTEVVPWLLEDKLKEEGGKYEKGGDWTSYAVQDLNLITGQNPQSSERVAQLMVQALRAAPGESLLPQGNIFGQQ